MAFCSSCGKELPAGAMVCPNCGAPVPGSTASTGTTAPASGFETLTKDSKAQEYWVERLIAYVVDAIIITVVLVIIGIAAFASLLTGPFGFTAIFFGGLALLGAVLYILYFTLLENMRGATIGKGLFHLKVVSKSGSKPTLGEAFIRNLSKIYWLLLLLDVIVGLAISKGFQQKYSDHLVGTTVTKA